MALGEHTGTNTKFTEGCWARFILSGAYLYKTLSGKHISHKSKPFQSKVNPRS